MLIYEVNLEVESGYSDAFERWLQGHIQEMLSFKGFEKACLYEIIEEADDEPGVKSWCVQYHVREHGDLNAYFRDHAARMRADGIRRFKQHFRATRRIMHEAEQQARVQQDAMADNAV